MSGQPMTCPDCGSLVLVDDGVIAYHTRTDDLTVCKKAGSKPETSKTDKPARKPRSKK